MIFRGCFYVVGLLLLALGLQLNTQAGLGVSAVLSVSYSISQIFALNFGNVTLCVYVFFILLQLFLRPRR